MAYDESLARRVRDLMATWPGVTERKMFGCLVFMIRGHMTVAIDSDRLMARVGPDVYEKALGVPHVSAEVFGDQPAKGYVMIAPDGLATDRLLRGWVGLCCTFVATLPDKAPKPKRSR